MECYYNCNIDPDSDFYMVRLDAYEEVGVCQSCYTNNCIRCEECNEAYLEDSVSLVSDDYYCESCITENASSCGRCLELCLDDRMDVVGGVLYCSVCAVYAEEEEALLEDENEDRDEDEPVHERYSRLALQELVNYNDDPANYIKNFNEFIKDDNLPYLGVEVEVASVDSFENRYAAILNYKEIFKEIGCLKHDGSILDSRGYYKGFEIVSKPMLLENHKECDAWKKLFNSQNNLLEIDSGKYGAAIHVHINRKAFDYFSLSHFIAFIHNGYNRNFLIKISERGESNYARYVDKSPYEHIASNDRVNKMHAVRLQKNNTVELRIFNSILCEKSFNKTIEFSEALYQYSKSLGEKYLSVNADKSKYKEFLELECNKYESFVKYVVSKDDKYPNLLDFMKNNNLIVEEKELIAV